MWYNGSPGQSRLLQGYCRPSRKGDGDWINSENVERQMDFIVVRQAKFSADIAELTASAAKHEQQIANLVDALLSLTNRVEHQGNEIAGLIQHGKDVERRFEETDGRLNALILA